MPLAHVVQQPEVVASMGGMVKGAKSLDSISRFALVTHVLGNSDHSELERSQVWRLTVGCC